MEPNDAKSTIMKPCDISQMKHLMNFPLSPKEQFDIHFDNIWTLQWPSPLTPQGPLRGPLDPTLLVLSDNQKTVATRLLECPHHLKGVRYDYHVTISDCPPFF